MMDHDTPPKGSDVPAAVAGTDLTPTPGPTSGVDTDEDASRKPSKIAWVVLGVLSLAALSFGTLRDDVLVEDDFSTPEVLRTWPDDGAAFTYADGSYHVAATSSGPSYAYHELPREVTGLTLTVDLRGERGRPWALVECVSEAVVDGSSEEVEFTRSYSFIFDLAGGQYAILDGRDVLDDGSLAAVSEVTVDCVANGSATTLGIQVPGADPIEVLHPNGAPSFVGVALGAFSESAGAEVAFDDLRVTGAE